MMSDEKTITRPLPRLNEQDTGAFWAATKDKKFIVNADMMNLLGCSKENFYKFLLVFQLNMMIE